MARKTKGIRKNLERHKRQTVPTLYRPNFMALMDGRLEITKALHARYDAIATDLGGIDALSTIQRSLLERFIWLEASVSKLEAEMGTASDAVLAAAIMDKWTRACASLLNFAKTLGLHRIKKKVDLKDYIANGHADGAGGVEK